MEDYNGMELRIGQRKPEKPLRHWYLDIRRIAGKHWVTTVAVNYQTKVKIEKDLRSSDES